MYDVKAFAIRTGKTIEVTVAGLLPNSCHQARIEDIYPGGNRIYLIDPGAAQVFIEETLKPGSDICLLQLIPWMGTVGIPDKTHKKIEIYVNNSEVLEIPVLDVPADTFFANSNKKEFIVIARTGSPGDHHVGCSIIPKDALYPAIYSQVFGPASYISCKNWVAANCGRSGEVNALQTAERALLGTSVSKSVLALESPAIALSSSNSLNAEPHADHNGVNCKDWRFNEVKSRIRKALSEWSREPLSSIVSSRTLGSLAKDTPWGDAQQIALISITNTNTIFAPYASLLDAGMPQQSATTTVETWEKRVWENQKPETNCFIPGSD